MESSFKAVRRPESNRVPCNWNIAASQDVLVIRFNPKTGLPAARAGCLERSASHGKFSRGCRVGRGTFGAGHPDGWNSLIPSTYFVAVMGARITIARKRDLICYN